MLLKIWCFTTGGGLVGVGIAKTVLGMRDMWEYMIVLGVMTIIAAFIQVLYKKLK